MNDILDDLFGVHRRLNFLIQSMEGTARDLCMSAVSDLAEAERKLQDAVKNHLARGRE